MLQDMGVCCSEVKCGPGLSLGGVDGPCRSDDVAMSLVRSQEVLVSRPTEI